jgi:hypothetical protein
MAKTKISQEEFVKLAIVKLRTGNFRGIHSVFSGFNEAFKKYYGDGDPIATTNALAEAGTIALRPVKRGVMLYMPEEAPEFADKAELALRKMGLLEPQRE